MNYFKIKQPSTYKEALLDFILCDFSLQFNFPSASLIFTPNTGLYTPISPWSLPNVPPPFSDIFQSSPILSDGFVILCIVPYVCQGGGAKLEVWMDLNGWVHVCVRNAILARNNYCTKTNPELDSHSGSWIHNGLGNQALWNTLEYDLMTAISIRPLTQPMMCETGLPIFAAMVQLKVASNTSASLPIIPSTERTNRENVSFNRSRSAHTCPLDFIPT